MSVGNGAEKTGRGSAGALIEAALELISPTRCAGCERPGELICSACENAMQIIDPARSCLHCGAPFGAMVCTECAGAKTDLDRCLAAAVFDGPVAPGRYGGLLVRADAVVFVPATAAAFRRRGFDHMELIARHLSGRSDIPLLDALVKHGSSDQRELGRADRLAEALGAYEVVLPVRGKRILLIDDVITTGATMSAAASALKAAGASRVDGLAFARVWG